MGDPKRRSHAARVRKAYIQGLKDARAAVRRVRLDYFGFCESEAYLLDEGSWKELRAIDALIAKAEAERGEP